MISIFLVFEREREREREREVKEEVVIFYCQRREGMRNVNAGSFIASILRAPQISCFPSKKEMGAVSVAIDRERALLVSKWLEY